MRTRIENVTLVTTDEANHLYPQGCLVIEDDTILALNDFDRRQAGIASAGNDQYALSSGHDSFPVVGR